MTEFLKSITGREYAKFGIGVVLAALIIYTLYVENQVYRVKQAEELQVLKKDVKDCEKNVLNFYRDVISENNKCVRESTEVMREVKEELKNIRRRR